MNEHVAWSDGHKITRCGDAHEMMIKVIKHEKVDMEQNNQDRYNHRALLLSVKDE
jgi:hypothetical protein